MRLPNLSDDEWGINKKFIIKSLFNKNTFTIPELAKEVSLSVPTVTKLVQELVQDKVVIACGKNGSGAGRRATIYELNPRSGYLLGIEIKNGNYSFGLANLKGEMVYEEYDRRYVANDESATTLAKIVKSIRESLENNDFDIDDIVCGCASLSGRVNPIEGRSYIHFNFSESTLARILSSKFNLPITIENDTRTMTYAELLALPNDEKQKNILFVNLGWGLGLGIVIKGELYGGKSGFAGEWGHLTAFDNEVLCHCGKKGCLETEVSGLALQREIISHIKAGKTSVLSNVLSRSSEITINEMINAIEGGDILAIELLEKLGEKLGKNLAGMINVFNPDTVIIGGPLSKANYYLLPPIRQAVNKYSLPLVHKDTNIISAHLDSKAGVIGSCLMARKIMFE